MRTHYGPWQPCWISNQHQKQKSCIWPSNEHFCQVWFKSVLWFQKKRWKCEIPIGSNVKLSRVMAAILNFRSANDSQIQYRTTQWSFLQSHNSIGLVVSNKKIFKISTNQNTLWALAAMLDFRSVPKTKALYMTIQWTFLPSLVQICFVVSEKKMKMWNSHRVQC